MATKETTYTSTEITAKGQKYVVTVASGKRNYVAVKKITNNPFGTLGKEFKTFDEAVRHYKSPEMKTELLKVEMGLI